MTNGRAPVSAELQRLVDDLAQQLGRSVVINDPGVHLLCASRHFGDEDPVRVHTVLQRTASAEIIAFVLAQHPGSWTTPGLLDGAPELGLLRRWCAPVRHDGVLLGLLMVIDGDGTLTGAERAAVAACAGSAAAQMHADQPGVDDERSRVEAAVRDLIGLDVHDREAAAAWLVAARALREAPHVVVTVVAVEPGAGANAQVVQALRSAEHGARSVGAVTGDGAVLVQVEAARPSVDALRAGAQRLLATLAPVLDPAARPVVGVGGAAEGLHGAWESHREAALAVRAARRTGRELAVWDELGAAGVLVQLPDVVVAERAVREPLRLLAAHAAGPRLLHTLRTYLDHAGSVPRTAAALHLHRTSLYYRLGQIRDLTGLDVDDGRTRLRLHLTLTLDELGFSTE